ncbi:HAMP domain-containing protein, partial [Clostridium botulinum]
MLEKIPIRIRLTVLSVLLLTICCIGLTIILNISAYHMADVIESTPTVPSTQFDPDKGFPIELKTEELALSETSQVARSTFLYQSIFYSILVVAVGAGLTYYISGKVLKPLQELSSQMKNRTVHNLSEGLPMPNSGDEIADLTLSFNQMSSKLDEAFAMQKRFSQSAAHELRTPLTVLKTKVEVFKKKKDHTA